MEQIKYFLFRVRMYMKDFNYILFILFLFCILWVLYIKPNFKIEESQLAHLFNYLTYSYISAWIFYMLVVFYPKKKKNIIANEFIYKRTGHIRSIAWGIYYHLLSQSGKEINKIECSLPDNEELKSLLSKCHCLEDIGYFDIHLTKEFFADYNDLLDELCRVLLIYVNDLFKFQGFLEDDYFKKLLMFENRLQVRNFNGGASKIKNADTQSLAMEINGLLRGSQSLIESSYMISRISFEKQKFKNKMNRK